MCNRKGRDRSQFPPLCHPGFQPVQNGRLARRSASTGTLQVGNALPIGIIPAPQGQSKNLSWQEPHRAAGMGPLPVRRDVPKPLEALAGKM